MSCLYERYLDRLDAVTAWTVLSNDTITLATTTRRVRGTAAMEFDKVDGTDDKAYGGAYRTVAFDLSDVDFLSNICWFCYVSSVANITHAYLRLGTSNANYVEYRTLVASLTAGIFNFCHSPLYEFAAIAGTCCDFSAVTYMEVGVLWDNEARALQDVAIDEIHIRPIELTRT